MSVNLDELAEAIAARAISRLRTEAATAGACPAPAPSGSPHCGAEGCKSGCSGKACGVKAVVDVGAARVGTNSDSLRTSRGLAPYIDHTQLKPEATREDIVKLCEEARQYGFATVCVNAANVGLAARLLEGSSTKAIAVVGFPLGAMTTSAKSFEAREAVRAGAAEIDMVINIGALKSRDYRTVFEDIQGVVQASRPAPVKVILETSMLDQDQKIVSCALSKAAGAAFVKTSTGFAGGGATVEDIALMRRIVGPDIGVKASGGVRSQDDALKMIAAGADRLGASASVAIVTGKTSTAKY